jgi:rfaE bifunctional protein nucleotidyltransferase chain/domain
MKKVFINGCFDILHRGHIEMLKYAKSMGDYLLVAIDSDTRVKHLKGQSRPINDQDDRKFMLESLRYVDEVVVFESSHGLVDVVNLYSPDLMIVGSDYRDKTVIGSEHAKEIHFFEKINGYSTTRTIQNISDR